MGEKSNYYVKKKRTLLNRFEELKPLIGNLVKNKYSELEFEDLFTRFKVDFAGLIPEIPYIGGPTNSYSFFLLDSAQVLAMIRVLEKIGLKYFEIGKFVYEFYENFYKDKKEKLEKVGQDPAERIFEKDYIDYLEVLGKKSQEREYQYDYVFEFIRGDGVDFDYGFNYKECGMHKFFKKLGFEKYTPLICLGDFADANICGFGLRRTQTVANGAPLCDHRYIKNLKTERAWPPDNVEEFKMKK